jgi:DNA-binding NarL/FixJ family response regulator
MNDQEILHDISRKLSVLIHLELDKGGSRRVQDHVTRLSRFGLATAAIAEILGTTTGTVAVAKNRVKKKRK